MASAIHAIDMGFGISGEGNNVINLELSTGVPLLYIYKEGNFMRRGSPVGLTVAGVYAYTKSLADYRQHLDEMAH